MQFSKHKRRSQRHRGSYMRKPLKQLALLGFAALATSLTSVGVAKAAFGPGEAFGFVWTEWGAAESTQTVAITGHQGKSLVTQRYILQPGFDGLWPTHQGPQSVMMVEGGGLNTYEGCGTEMVPWENGKAYYRDGSTSPTGLRVTNASSEVTQVIVTYVDVSPDDAFNTLPWGDQANVNAGCTAPSSEGFKHHEYGRGPAATDIPWDHEAGTMTISMQWDVAPRWQFVWHTHPPTFITHLRGTGFREYIGCDITLDWEPNVNYLHSPGAYSRPQERARNIDYDDNAEFMTMFTKAPKQRTRGQIPVEFTAPPDGCLTDGTVTRTD
jgi:hypothetical protein